MLYMSHFGQWESLQIVLLILGALPGTIEIPGPPLPCLYFSSLTQTMWPQPPQILLSSLGLQNPATAYFLGLKKERQGESKIDRKAD